MCMWIQGNNLIFIGILTEAIVNLLFTGTVLQPFREWVIKYIPLRVRGEHLLECKLCTSFWVGILCVVLVKYTMGDIMALILWGIVVHRVSNYIHLIYSIIKDYQMDIRVARRKK